jgi:hypothetical protein
MSLSNTTETAALDVFLRGTDPSYRAGATQYLALFTSGINLEAGSIADEATYTGYARVALTKASAWTGTASPFTNTNLIQFGACTALTSSVTHFAVVDTASGAVNMMISGALSGPLAVAAGIQPQFAANALSIVGSGGVNYSALAAAIRAEIAVELARIDVATSTRSASGAYTAAIAALPTLAELQAAVLPVEVTKINNITVTGSGTELDPWGP